MSAIPTVDRLPLMAVAAASRNLVEQLRSALEDVESSFDDDHETNAVALQSIAHAAVIGLSNAVAAVVAWDEAHGSPALVESDDARLGWTLIPGDRSMFAGGPLDQGFVLVDRRNAQNRIDHEDRRTTSGLIVWSPVRQQWEHWLGGRCSDTDRNVWDISDRNPRADVHAPADTDGVTR